MEQPKSAAGDPYDKSFIQPSMEKFEDFDQVIEKEESLSTSLVSNGCVDFHGKVADKKKTGGWKASPFIIVNEVAERLAFFAVAVNMGLTWCLRCGNRYQVQPPMSQIGLELPMFSHLLELF
ncbi:protein NRT1/ PTR FAMILY 8.2-like [Prunus yedoensis var. nudiflora]|uniref:Protein NRT1/ PTR FAMILY 8.2-like n=1 Tax=Prunus yedoensis var. nudiflora TaxID=2094558 RepID=A0A314YFQ2_PRUYE|nr:protein NRT1/ PTR FAMILY 8.2-like [Prunus yedoensis var. nudiflora]